MIMDQYNDDHDHLQFDHTGSEAVPEREILLVHGVSARVRIADRSDPLRLCAKLLVLDRGHRRDGIDSRNLDLAVVSLLNHDVAGEHRPDLVFQRQRLVGELGVARAEDEIWPEVSSDLLV